MIDKESITCLLPHCKQNLCSMQAKKKGWKYMQKMVMIPEWRYQKMMQTYSALAEEVQGLKDVILPRNYDGADGAAENLEELFNFFCTDAETTEQDTDHKRTWTASAAVREYLTGKLPSDTLEEAMEVIILAMGEFEKSGFINGFRYAARIFKEC